MSKGWQAWQPFFFLAVILWSDRWVKRGRPLGSDRGQSDPFLPPWMNLPPKKWGQSGGRKYSLTKVFSTLLDQAVQTNHFYLLTRYQSSFLGDDRSGHTFDVYFVTLQEMSFSLSHKDACVCVCLLDVDTMTTRMWHTKTPNIWTSVVLIDTSWTLWPFAQTRVVLLMRNGTSTAVLLLLPKNKTNIFSRL